MMEENLQHTRSKHREELEQHRRDLIAQHQEEVTAIKKDMREEHASLKAEHVRLVELQAAEHDKLKRQHEAALAASAAEAEARHSKLHEALEQSVMHLKARLKEHEASIMEADEKHIRLIECTRPPSQPISMMQRPLRSIRRSLKPTSAKWRIVTPFEGRACKLVEMQRCRGRDKRVKENSAALAPIRRVRNAEEAARSSKSIERGSLVETVEHLRGHLGNEKVIQNSRDSLAQEIERRKEEKASIHASHLQQVAAAVNAEREQSEVRHRSFSPRRSHNG